MSTIKTRINITASREMERALAAIAKRDRVPVATKAAELLCLALELEEDLMLGAIAEERMKGNPRYISHEKAWKNFV
jgi:hypothetical protein